MKCNKPDFFNVDSVFKKDIDEDRPELPDKLTDCLTGKEIPFSNRDNIRQKALKFLLEEKDYLKTDISVDREIKFEIDGLETVSQVDISISLDNKTLVVWKCSSGSLVSRERQIIASARLLADYVVPFAVVTNGKDLELLDTLSEKIISEGFGSFPSRQELVEISKTISFKPKGDRKISNEQRILYTYDAISCNAFCNKESSPDNLPLE